MTAEVTITIRIDESITVHLTNPHAPNALAHAKGLLDKLGAVSDGVRPLANSLASSPGGPPARPKAPEPAAPPRATSETNGHGPKKRERAPVSQRRERRKFTDEQKRAGAERAREVGATKAAEEFDVVPTVVRGWLKKHPKEHAAGPITGTPPAVGESRDDWEARRRAAAAGAM